MPKFEAKIAHGPASNPLQVPIQVPAERPADGIVDMPLGEPGSCHDSPMQKDGAIRAIEITSNS